jgi:hypothetical protein
VLFRAEELHCHAIDRGTKITDNESRARTPAPHNQS